MTAAVDDEEVAVGRNGDIGQLVEQRRPGRAPIAAKTRHIPTGDLGDDTGLCVDPEYTIGRIREVEIPSRSNAIPAGEPTPAAVAGPPMPLS